MTDPVPYVRKPAIPFDQVDQTHHVYCRKCKQWYDPADAVEQQGKGVVITDNPLEAMARLPAKVAGLGRKNYYYCHNCLRRWRLQWTWFLVVAFVLAAILLAIKLIWQLEF